METVNRGYINDELEHYVEIPSDNVAFDEAPAMKAQEITNATVALLRSGEYRYGRINFANGDMVGHTGNLDAAISAMETVDHCVQQLIDLLLLNKREFKSWMGFSYTHLTMATLTKCLRNQKLVNVFL